MAAGQQGALSRRAPPRIRPGLAGLRTLFVPLGLALQTSAFCGATPARTPGSSARAVCRSWDTCAISSVEHILAHDFGLLFALRPFGLRRL